MNSKVLQKFVGDFVFTKFMGDSLACYGSLFDDERDKGETDCVIINEDEIYFIERDEEGKEVNRRRICGHLRTKDGRKLRCRSRAGKGTNHTGIGKCSFHSRIAGPGRNLRLAKKYKSAGLALGLKELLELEPQLLNDKKLGEIGEEILVLEEMLKEILNTPIYPDSLGNTPPLMVIYGDSVLSLISSIISAKVSKSKIETDKLLFDMNSIRLFVNIIVEVAKKVLSTDSFSRFMVELEKAMIFPINRPMQKLIADATVVEKEIIDV